MSKTLILHDTFLYRGGGERLVLMMANTLDADIASGFSVLEAIIYGNKAFAVPW